MPERTISVGQGAYRSSCDDTRAELVARGGLYGDLSVSTSVVDQAVARARTVRLVEEKPRRRIRRRVDPYLVAALEADVDDESRRRARAVLEQMPSGRPDAEVVTLDAPRRRLRRRQENADS